MYNKVLIHNLLTLSNTWYGNSFWSSRHLKQKQSAVEALDRVRSLDEKRKITCLFTFTHLHALDIESYVILHWDM